MRITAFFVLMDDNLKIIYKNRVNTATLGASPAMEPTLPVHNLKTIDRGRIAQTTSTADQAITFNLADNLPQLIGGMALTGHNLGATATIRYRLWEGENQTGTVLYDSGTIDAVPARGWGTFLWGEPWGDTTFQSWDSRFSVIFFDTVLARSGQIDISDSQAVTSYFQFRRLFAGPVISPKYNADFGLQAGWNENTKQERTDGGTLRSDTSGVPYRSIQLNLSHIGNAERGQWWNIIRDIGTRQDIFISIFPAERVSQQYIDFGMAAKLKQMPQFSIPSVARWQTTYEFQET